MEKDGSYVNEDLDRAFVEGDGNKTMSKEEETDNNWNLLEDPMLREEPSSNSFNLNELDNDSNNNTLQLETQKMGFYAQSSIKFNEKAAKSTATQPAKRIDEEDEDDLKELYAEM